MAKKVTKTKKGKKLFKNWKPWAIGVAAVVLLVLVFSLVPIVRVSYRAEEMYPAIESYYVKEIHTDQEPYTILEPYTVLEPYTEIEVFCDEEPCEKYIPIDYQVVRGVGYNTATEGTVDCTVELYIKNTDVEGGTFSVEFLVTLRGGSTKTISGSKYIAAGLTGRVVASYFGYALKTPYAFSYSVTPPTKLNPSYRELEVTKYREVTRYNEVTKEEYVPTEVTVLKTRTVTLYKRVSLLDYLVNY